MTLMTSGVIQRRLWRPFHKTSYKIVLKGGLGAGTSASFPRGVLWRRSRWYSETRYVALLPRWVREVHCLMTYVNYSHRRRKSNLQPSTKRSLTSVMIFYINSQRKELLLTLNIVFKIIKLRAEYTVPVMRSGGVCEEPASFNRINHTAV